LAILPHRCGGKLGELGKKYLCNLTRVLIGGRPATAMPNYEIVAAVGPHITTPI
jgi:hypothetical protein